jgi:TetR/AcrR family transcriptional regulator, cholesterol catabolism regulator
MDSTCVGLSTFDVSGHPGAGQSDRRTVEKLLDTAARLFCERGYAATTTREIASALGIQQASLYYHITSKEDILYQICVSSLEQLLADVQTAVTRVSDPLDRVRVLARTHLGTILRYQIRHVTMLNELRALSDPHRAAVISLRKRYANVVRSVLEDGQAAGAIRTDIPAKYLYLALLNILNWAVLWFRRGQKLSADQVARIFISIYLNGAAGAGQRVAQSSSPVPLYTRGKSSIASQSIPARLLETAAVLFSRKGYAATSTREIAAMLGIQKPSLYYHIDTKEDLLHAICKSSLEQIRADVSAALENVQEAEDRVRMLVRAHVDNLVRDQARHAAAVSEMRALSGNYLTEIIVARDAYEKLVRSVLKEAQRAGVLRQDIPVKYLCLSLLGLLNRVEVWYRPNGPLSSGELAQVFETIYLSGATSSSQVSGL